MARSKKKKKATKAKAKPKQTAKKAAKAAKKAKKPAAKKPAAKAAKPAAKAAKPAAKKPAAKAAKPVAKKPAATQPAAEAAPATPTSEHLAQLAMTGDLEVLFGLMDGEAKSDRDGLAYKWLSVASDFGHEDADDMIGDLLEASSLRYDDDQFETGNAHWELGLAYLTGTEGLPRDLEKARGQLASAKERGYPMSVQESEAMLVQARARLAPDALAVFDAVYDGTGPGVIDDRADEGEEDEGEDEDEE